MCTKFETTGLLYACGELARSEAAEYEAHLAECETCRAEVEAYRTLRASFFTADILGDEVSPETDAKILSAIASSPRVNGSVASAKKPSVPASFMIPMMFIKKYAPVPIFVMLIAVAIGGYVRHHAMTAESLRAAASANAQTEIAADVNDDADTAASDTGRMSPRPLGDMNRPGVVPVSGE